MMEWRLSAEGFVSAALEKIRELNSPLTPWISTGQQGLLVWAKGRPEPGIKRFAVRPMQHWVLQSAWVHPAREQVALLGGLLRAMFPA